MPLTKDVKTMDISRKHLLASGFTESELQKLQKNIDNYGGTMEDVIKDLAKRFKVAVFILFFMAALFTYALLFSSLDEIISLGLALLIAAFLVIFIQPPLISYKSWRFYSINSD